MAKEPTTLPDLPTAPAIAMRSARRGTTSSMDRQVMAHMRISIRLPILVSSRPTLPTLLSAVTRWTSGKLTLFPTPTPPTAAPKMVLTHPLRPAEDAIPAGAHTTSPHVDHGPNLTSVLIDVVSTPTRKAQKTTTALARPASTPPSPSPSLPSLLPTAAPPLETSNKSIVSTFRAAKLFRTPSLLLAETRSRQTGARLQARLASQTLEA